MKFLSVFFPIFALWVAIPVSGKTFETQEYSIRVESRFSGLNYPWGMDFLPDGRLLVSEKGGVLLAVDLEDKTSVRIKNVPRVWSRGQGGLLDARVDGSNPERPAIYFTYSAPDGTRASTAAARAELNGDRLENLRVLYTARPGSRAGRHFGSRVRLAPDGTLYLSVGDRGNAEDAQKLDSSSGKILRLKPGGGVPEDNPFPNKSGVLPEIFSYGHRNPQGMAVHPETGAVWTSEHGARGGDEINVIRPGLNYGWPVISYGTHYSGLRIGSGTAKEGMEQPAHYWVPSIAPSGMTFYNGGKFPKWNGNLFVSSLKFGKISRLEIKGEAVVGEELIFDGEFGRIRDVRQTPSGTLVFITDESPGEILEIFPNSN